MYKRRSSSTTRPRSSSVRKPSGASTSRSMSSGYGQKINKDRNAEYGYPQYLMDGANEYLKETPPKPKPTDLPEDWNLSRFAASQKGRATMYRDESVQFFSNLKRMYTSTMQDQVSRPFTTNPPNFLQLQVLQEEQAMKNRPTNLPAYCHVPYWYPQDDPDSYYDMKNPLGGKFRSRHTYAAEMNRVPLRQWESTNLGRLMEADDQSIVGASGVRFTVMSYNVLSPRLLETHMYLYKNHDPSTLDFDNRCRTFMAEISHYQPDIIGLQEIDSAFVELYDQLFLEIGFKGIFKRRTRDKNDGCSIYYRDSKFRLVDKLAVEYYQPHVPILDRDNVGLFVKLESKQGRKHKVVVGTTHLLYNPKRHDVKLAQVQLMLAELDRFSFCGLDKSGCPIYHPTMITGDFNTEPYSPITKLITEGKLQHIDKHGTPIIPLKRRGGDVFIPPYFGISDQCQHYKVVDARIKCQKARKVNNFEIETTASKTLVNVLQSDSYSGELQALTALKIQEGSSQYPQPSKSTQLKASDYSFAPDSVMSDVQPSRSELKMEESEECNVPQVDTKILERIKKHGTLCTFGSGEFSHQFNFRDVHGPKLDRQGNHEGIATTKQNGWVCVDYIYYSMVWNEQFKRLTEGKLKLIRRLGLLSRPQCQQLGSIPQHDIPSDHFPLVAEFLLKN